MAFASIDDRVHFIRGDAADREKAITEVLNEGYVRRDDGGVVEVAL
jgi:hypothetical protein